MTAPIKFTLTLLVGLVLSLLIYFLLLNPALGRLRILSGELMGKKVELATVTQQVIAYKNAQTDLSKAEQKEKIFKAFLEKTELVAAVKGLERAAALTKTSETLKINELDPAASDAPEPVVPSISGLTEIPYRITTFNDYLGTVQFLRFLEHLPQFTEISKINLSAETAESESKTRVYTGRVFGAIDGVFFVRDLTQTPSKSNENKTDQD